MIIYLLGVALSFYFYYNDSFILGSSALLLTLFFYDIRFILSNDLTIYIQRNNDLLKQLIVKQHINNRLSYYKMLYDSSQMTKEQYIEFLNSQRKHIDLPKVQEIPAKSDNILNKIKKIFI